VLITRLKDIFIPKARQEGNFRKSQKSKEKTVGFHNSWTSEKSLSHLSQHL